jgi:hypothetical protein
MVAGMKKRTLVRMRKALRTVTFGLLLAAVLSVDTLLMIQLFSYSAGSSQKHQPVTMSPGLFF